MTVSSDFQGLIDWCTKPHPTVKPHLRRVVNGDLEYFYVPSDDGLQNEWKGVLTYSPKIQHQTLGIFEGALTNLINPNHQVQVWLTIAKDDAWIGIQGPSIESEWSEDVHISNYLVSDDGTVAIITFVGNKSKFDLILSVTYLYGG